MDDLTRDLLEDCNRLFTGRVCQKIEIENGKIAVYLDNGYKLTAEAVVFGYATHEAFSTEVAG